MFVIAAPALDRTTMRGRQPAPRTTPLGIWLSEAREARGWTLRKTAEMSDLSHVRVSQIENGVTGDVPRETVRRLARALYAGDSDGPGWEKFESAALDAAGYKTELQAIDLSTDPVDILLSDESVIGYEAGFDDLQTEFTDEDREQLRAGINAFVRAWAEQNRDKKKGK